MNYYKSREITLVSGSWVSWDTGFSRVQDPDPSQSNSVALLVIPELR